MCDKIRDYLRHRKVPRFFQKVVMDYFQHTLSGTMGRATETEVMGDLPPTLKVRLGLMLKRDVMLRVPFFANFSADLFIHIVQVLQQVTFLPGEFIIEAGIEVRGGHRPRAHGMAIK